MISIDIPEIFSKLDSNLIILMEKQKISELVTSNDTLNICKSMFNILYKKLSDNKEYGKPLANFKKHWKRLLLIWIFIVQFIFHQQKSN